MKIISLVGYSGSGKTFFIINAIKVLDLDIKQITEILNFEGFEFLIKEILSMNNYITIKNFRFSDKSNFFMVFSLFTSLRTLSNPILPGLFLESLKLI